MIGAQIHAAAAAETSTINFDFGTVLDGVYAKRRRRTRSRRILIGSPVAVALAVSAVTLPSVLSPRSAPAALAAYQSVAVAPDAVPVASVDDVALFYLPAEIDHEPVSQQVSTFEDGTTTQTCWEDLCKGGLAVTVTRSSGLTLDDYLTANWFGGATETSVDGHRALANGVSGDEASGLVWSPAAGTVIEVHFGADRAAELRQVVEQMVP